MSSWRKDPEIGQKALDSLDTQKRMDDYVRELAFHHKNEADKYKHALTTLTLAVQSLLHKEGSGDVSQDLYKLLRSLL